MAEGDRHRITDLVESATMSPAKNLDLGVLHDFKAIVRASDANVRIAFDLLFDKLKKNNSQVRYLTLLLIDELFRRSKLFRSLLVPKFEMFMLLTIGYRADYTLPKPSDRATLLRATSMEYVEKWNEMFGVHYKPVHLGYEYLKKTLRLQFPNVREAAAMAERQRQEKEERTQVLLQKKYESLIQEFPDWKAEIQSTMDQMTECFKILIPEAVHYQGATKEGDLKNIGEQEEEDEYEEYGNSSLRRQLHQQAAEENDLPEKPRETGENATIFGTLRDLYKLLMMRHLPSTQEWLSTLMRVDPPQEKQQLDVFLKEVIDLRSQLLAFRKHCEDLGIELLEVGRTSKALTTVEDEGEDEIIWEEGGSGFSFAEAKSVSQSTKTDEEVIKKAARDVAGASTSNSSMIEQKLTSHEIDEGTGLRHELLKEAPLLSWGAFLDTWGGSSDMPANQRGLQLENHWGKVDTEAIIPAEKIAELNVRSSYYKPVKTEIQPCLAPLRNGGLCQRRDLHRCPLHGPIVPRDKNGVPVGDKCKNEQESEEHHVGQTKNVLLDGNNGASSSAPRTSKDGDDLDLSLASQADIATQAIANVRERDKVDIKRKREEQAKAKLTQSRRDREHNEAVLRSAAISHSRQGFAEAIGENLDDPFMEDEGGSRVKRRARGGLAALLKRKPTAKDRLAQRLLSGRVRDATINQLTRDEDANYREAFPNQW
ncbi:hypothetical protein BDL97_07G120100 [Sphagnum fallax]|nr:hypothetical protein BDL97_07G120100 [Sphagnum fallax]